MANEQELIKAAELDSAVAAAVKRWQSVDMTYMPVYPGGQKQFDEDCQALAVKYMNSLASRKGEPVAITEERLIAIGVERCSERLMIKSRGKPWLSFDKIDGGYGVYHMGSRLIYAWEMNDILQLLAALGIEVKA